MNDTQKPFACSEKGCEMTFTNEDHLNCHQKKHDMILNLGLAKTNDVADQTPTPTRFIRNCEEVGLFQDLQNVNPFDEYFKKAVEEVKTGCVLEVPEANSDDTLHTPHILPHIEVNQKKLNNVRNQDNNSQSNEFSLNVITITTSTPSLPHNNNNEQNSELAVSVGTPVIVIEDEEINDIKKKIKEALQNKEKQKIEKEKQKAEKENLANRSGSNITVVPFKNLAIPRETSEITDSEKNEATIQKPVDDTREKIREMNRAAQIRCRKRKQLRWKEMEEELRLLKAENKVLKVENASLLYQLMEKEETTQISNKGAVPGTIIGTLVPMTTHRDGAVKGPNIRSPTSTNSPLSLNISPNKTTSPTTSNSILIQIVPGTSQPMPVPIHHDPLTNAKIENFHSLSMDKQKPRQKKRKDKNLRKIIPKIIIEN